MGVTVTVLLTLHSIFYLLHLNIEIVKTIYNIHIEDSAKSKPLLAPKFCMDQFADAKSENVTS